MGYETFAFTGKLTGPGGAPHRGKVTITPTVNVVRDVSGNVVIAGPVTREIDPSGSFRIDGLPCTDDPGLSPTGFGYTVSIQAFTAKFESKVFDAPRGTGVRDYSQLVSIPVPTPIDPLPVSLADFSANDTEVRGLIVELDTTKADQQFVTDELAVRDQSAADESTRVNTELGKKATPQDVADAVAPKADTAYVDEQVGTRATPTDVSTAVAAEADRVDSSFQAIAFGIDADGNPYYDPDVAPAELARVEVIDGVVVVTRDTQSVAVVTADVTDALDAAKADKTYVDSQIGGLSSTFVAAKDTAYAGNKSINASPVNTVGPNATAYTIFGGSQGAPNTVGDAILPFLSGYDNHVWDSSIANVLQGHHTVGGGSNGHNTVMGGSYGLAFGGYSMVGGTQNGVFADYSTAPAGRINHAGANAATTLSVAAKAGDTSITVASTTGIANGQVCYIDHGSNVERATVTGVAGSVVSLSTFQHVSTTNVAGASTGTGIAAAHAVGTVVRFSDNAAIDSTVSGGLNNRTAAKGATVPGGQNNVASGQWSTAAGNGNTASGQAAVALGEGTVAEAYGSTALGMGSRARTQGQVAQAAGTFSTPGDAQTSVLTLRTTTTDATTKSLSMQAAPNAAVIYRADIVVHDATGAGDVSAKAFTVQGAYRCNGTTTVTQIGTPTVTTVAADPAAAAWTVATLVGTGTFNLRITGEAGKTLRWVARVTYTEVI